MSDEEESFVILGSSPLSSMESDGIYTRKQSSDTPGSCFTSLQSSQISNLKSALEYATSQQSSLNKTSTPLTQSINKSTETDEAKNPDEIMATNRASSGPTSDLEFEGRMNQLSLADCAVNIAHETQKVQEKSSVEGEEQINNPTKSCSVDGNLAASFIMGEINSDILKTSVYSQFPSISVNASAEEVLKLQNMVTEYSQLKSMIKKANSTMQLFYQNSLQWKLKMKTMEEDYKQQLDDCKKEILELRTQNYEMDKNLKAQIEALDIAHKQDREEYIKEISLKNALLENMRAQIVRLEEKQLNSFDIVQFDKKEEQQTETKVAEAQHEQDMKIKELQRQLSELLASNLDLKDLEKQYIDELDCLKINLTAAEELLTKNSSEITQLKSVNMEKDEKLQNMKTSLESLQVAFEEQQERIALLETQNEVHRADFEIEKHMRETAVKEKQQMLQDLRSLQKRNQELIEEQQKLADNYQRRISSTVAASIDAKINAASVAAENYNNNPQQRPIRILPAPTTLASSSAECLHKCPICQKAFKSLNILLRHVDDCMDKN